MTGLIYWDAVAWLVIGVIAGVVLSRWGSLRLPLFLALLVAVAGFLLVPAMFLIFAEQGAVYAIQIVTWSVPMPVGLALGAAASRLWR